MANIFQHSKPGNTQDKIASMPEAAADEDEDEDDEL